MGEREDKGGWEREKRGREDRDRKAQSLLEEVEREKGEREERTRESVERSHAPPRHLLVSRLQLQLQLNPV